MSLLVLVGAILCGLAWWIATPARQRARRRRWHDATPPATWAPWLERKVPLYRRLPAPLKEALLRHMGVFLHEKRFVGCNGLEVDDDMRLVVAAQACVLLLGHARDYFPGFTSVLLYPDSFVVPITERHGALETRREEVRSGESWQRGPVVLSWLDVQHDLHAGDARRSVVLHEFAHKLDEENGSIDGVPALADDGQLGRWREAFGRAFERRHDGRQTPGPTSPVIDDYALSAPPEFFATLVEGFFCQPVALALYHPEIYALLREYFALDPAGWPP